jgi:hypothetical protein
MKMASNELEITQMSIQQNDSDYKIHFDATKSFIIGVSERNICIYDLDGQEEDQRAFAPDEDHVDVSSDRKLIVHCSNRVVSLYSYGDLSRIGFVNIGEIHTHIIRFSPNGKLIAGVSGHPDFYANRIWIVRTADIARSLPHTEFILDAIDHWEDFRGFIEFSRYGSKLYYAGSDRIRVWDVSKLETERSTDFTLIHELELYRKDRDDLSDAEADEEAEEQEASDERDVFDSESGQVFFINGFAIDNETGNYSIVKVHADGNAYVDVFEANKPHAFYYSDGLSVLEIKDSNIDDEKSLSYSPDGNYLCIANSPFEGMISILNAKTHRFMQSLDVVKRYIVNVLWTKTSLIVQSSTDKLYVYRVRTKQDNLLAGMLEAGYKDLILRSEYVLRRDLSLEALKTLGQAVGLPGANLYDNSEILRRVLITFREVSIEIHPEKFKTEQDIENDVANQQRPAHASIQQ